MVQNPSFVLQILIILVPILNNDKSLDLSSKSKFNQEI